MSNENRLGIDIGRVIIDGEHHPDGSDTAFFDGDEAAMLRTPAVPDALAAIARLTASFDGRVWLVSKCGPRVQQRTLRWLRHHRFFELTAVPSDNVRFCLRRTDKGIHCAELGITHFVDDKADVHEALEGLVPNRYLFGAQRRAAPPTNVVAVSDWSQTEHAINASLAQRYGR